ncbi:MAG TPA: hypothetical protein VGO89_08965, partial [Streptomyces sp.]|nr:hypothetical protein [Streptomyces sp.]
MKDPLDQWAEGETPSAFQGGSPGHGAKSAGKRRKGARRDAGKKGPTEPEQPVVAISDPVNVVGPTRYKEVHQPRPQPS